MNIAPETNHADHTNNNHGHFSSARRVEKKTNLGPTLKRVEATEDVAISRHPSCAPPYPQLILYSPPYSMRLTPYPRFGEVWITDTPPPPSEAFFFAPMIPCSSLSHTVWI